MGIPPPITGAGRNREDRHRQTRQTRQTDRQTDRHSILDQVAQVAQVEGRRVEGRRVEGRRVEGRPGRQAR